MGNRNREKGFTLIEVLIAMTLLVIGILAVASMQIASLGGNSQAIRITEAVTWADDTIETIMSLPYTHADLDDTNGDCAAGLTDPDCVAGLNYTNVGDQLADHGPVVHGGFTVYWNVADGTPLPNIKTIRVIVVRTDKGGQVKRLAVDYLKTNDS
jgi:type IV pilus assembly protein PilV